MTPTGAATLGAPASEIGRLVDLDLSGAWLVDPATGRQGPADLVAFSDDGSPIQGPELFRNALAYAGMLALPLVEHPEDLALTAGAEANEGLISTVLGLRGWPAAAEAVAVARDLALLTEVATDVPGARLHLTHPPPAAAT